MKQMLMAVGVIALTVSMARVGVGQAAAAPMQMEHHDQKAGARSTSLVVNAGGKSVTLTAAELQAMPQRTLVVHNGHSNVDESYTGVGLSDLLAKFGLTLDNGGAQKVYHSYVKAEGMDKYWVLYSASELEQGLHTGDAIVALSVDGKPLGADGAFKMIAGAEKRPARWVRNLCKLTIVTVQ